jgi:hypothetical protein
MSHFYFDLKGGVPVRDRSGYDCFDERQARGRAHSIAKEVAIKQPELIGKAYISVINDQGREIYRAQVLRRSAEERNAE